MDKEQLKRLLDTKREYQASPYFQFFKLSEKQTGDVRDLTQKFDKFAKFILDVLSKHEDGIKKITEFVFDTHDYARKIENVKIDLEKLKGEQGDEGLDGEDYMLTQKDIEDIAEVASKKITPPVVEKVVERIETIREIPIIQPIKETTREIIKEIKETAPQLTWEEIARGLESLGYTQKLDYTLGLKNKPLRQKEKSVMRGGGDIIQAGSNITIVSNSDGTKTISTSFTGLNVLTESLQGTQSGDNVTLNLTQLTNTFSTILFVTRQGQILTPTESWTRSGNTITITNASAGNTFLVSYLY